MSARNIEGLPGPHSFAAPAEEVERRVADIAAIIRAAEPERRGELKDLAEALLHDEISTIAEGSTTADEQARSYGLNPLVPGILIVLLSLGFFMIFPVVGLMLAALGAVLVIWGGMMSWLKK